MVKEIFPEEKSISSVTLNTSVGGEVQDPRMGSVEDLNMI